jgi:hypothetical protein
VILGVCCSTLDFIGGVTPLSTYTILAPLPPGVMGLDVIAIMGSPGFTVNVVVLDFESIV